MASHDHGEARSGRPTTSAGTPADDRPDTAADDGETRPDGGTPVTGAADGERSPSDEGETKADGDPATTDEPIAEPAGVDETDAERSGSAETSADAELLVAERETEEGLLVAVCDGDVLGETFEEGQVSLTVTEEFYAGDAVDADGVVESLRRATVANIVGTRAVEIAIDAGIVDEANVLEVESTLHAQLVRLS